MKPSSSSTWQELRLSECPKITPHFFTCFALDIKRSINMFFHIFKQKYTLPCLKIPNCKIHKPIKQIVQKSIEILVLMLKFEFYDRLCLFKNTKHVSSIVAAWRHQRSTVVALRDCTCPGGGNRCPSHYVPWDGLSTGLPHPTTPIDVYCVQVELCMHVSTLLIKRIKWNSDDMKNRLYKV